VAKFVGMRDFSNRSHGASTYLFVRCDSDEQRKDVLTTAKGSLRYSDIHCTDYVDRGTGRDTVDVVEYTPEWWHRL
jgi:hypothetical protein